MTSYTDVYFSLRGAVYANNSVIYVTEIGETEPTGLQCITYRKPCSAPSGEWLLPEVWESKTDNMFAPFNRSRSTDGTVTLYRANDTVMSPAGLFCCEVTDAEDKNQEVCINICEHSSGNSHCMVYNYYVQCFL